MDVEPKKFFVGVVDVFAVLIPGALVTFLVRDWVTVLLLWRPTWPLQAAYEWVIFLLVSYLLGHITFLLSAALDPLLYDALRKQTDFGQIERLSRGEPLSSRRLRLFASRVFPGLRNTDNALWGAIRLKARALESQSAGDAINAFQWCKARLSKDHPEGLAAVQRFEADSKFFRSFAVVLIGLTAYCAGQQAWTLAAATFGALVIAVWRYVEQRFKATQHAYALVITLEGMREPPLAAYVRNEADGLTHAGGVVYQGSEGGRTYLLVESSARRGEWVLPKGHIEPGELPRETAVREVREESGHWARVVDWIDDVSFPRGTESIRVRFFLMEFAELNESGKPPLPIDRRHRWTSLDSAPELTDFRETQLLLAKAEELTRHPSSASTNRGKP